ncbi:MAG: tyrosine recombinase XerC [Hyphomonadaceae bacterium]
MATLKLRWVQTFKQSGARYYYFRRAGYPRIRLPGHPGEALFMQAYEMAASASAESAPPRAAPGTFNALCIAYYRSPNFKSLAKITQATYRNVLEGWRVEHGAKRVTHLRRQDVISHITTRNEKQGSASANGLLKMLRIICAFAVEESWRHDNPAAGVPRFKRKSQGFPTWSEEDVTAYLNRWPPGSRERLALLLLLHTGQRRADVVRMGRQHLAAGKMRVAQSKTGTELVLPIHADLRAELDALPADALTFLTTAYGASFTAAGFGNRFREWCDAAGVKKAAHGLRKLICKRLAEAGCSAVEIRAVTGHKSLVELETYVQAAEQERLAGAAMGRLG